jgi:hypothetical protein
LLRKKPWITSTVRLLGALVCCLALSRLTVSNAFADTRPWPRTCPASDRFGVAVVGWIGDYDVTQLDAGWYHSFTILGDPPHPSGMGYVQTIRISDDGPFSDRACSTCPPWTTLEGVARTNPGSLWIVGNEPDRQDYVYAERYAQLYHDLYGFLKAVDPSSQVGVGGVVQTTPIRLQYLDMVLDSYRARYGRAMPVDVWNVHHYLLREANDWGGGIPPGTDTSLALKYEIQEHDMLERSPTDPEKLGWKQHLVEMRQWMRDRGYRDRPLIITEYGILMPELYEYDYLRVKSFMLATFDWMMTATDPEIGYPADENRLVQAWAWYSLNDPAFENWTSWNHLFDPDTRAITALGQDFASYVEPFTSPAIELEPTFVRLSYPEPGQDNLTAVTLLVDVYNGGAETAKDVIVRVEREGLPPEEATIPSLAAGETRTVSIDWPYLSVGQSYQVTVTVDPDDAIAECVPSNNSRTVDLLVADHWIYLPLSQQNW